MSRHVNAAAVKATPKATIVAAFGSICLGTNQNIGVMAPARNASAVKETRIGKA